MQRSILQWVKKRTGMIKLAACLVCQSQFSYKAVARVGKKSNETKSILVRYINHKGEEGLQVQDLLDENKPSAARRLSYCPQSIPPRLWTPCPVHFCTSCFGCGKVCGQKPFAHGCWPLPLLYEASWSRGTEVAGHVKPVHSSDGATLQHHCWYAPPAWRLTTLSGPTTCCASSCSGCRPQVPPFCLQLLNERARRRPAACAHTAEMGVPSASECTCRFLASRSKRSAVLQSIIGFIAFESWSQAASYLLHVLDFHLQGISPKNFLVFFSVLPHGRSLAAKLFILVGPEPFSSSLHASAFLWRYAPVLRTGTFSKLWKIIYCKLTRP